MKFALNSEVEAVLLLPSTPVYDMWMTEARASVKAAPPARTTAARWNGCTVCAYTSATSCRGGDLNPETSCREGEVRRESRDTPCFCHTRGTAEFVIYGDIEPYLDMPLAEVEARTQVLKDPSTVSTPSRAESRPAKEKSRKRRLQPG